MTAERVIKPQYVVEKISEITKGRPSSARRSASTRCGPRSFYNFTQPRTLHLFRRAGDDGVRLPRRPSARSSARPDETVFDIAGDGSIQMNIQELIAAVQHRLPIMIAILNNGYLGMVRQWQQLFYDKRYSHTCINCHPDFVKLAEPTARRESDPKKAGWRPPSGGRWESPTGPSSWTSRWTARKTFTRWYPREVD